MLLMPIIYTLHAGNTRNNPFALVQLLAIESRSSQTRSPLFIETLRKQLSYGGRAQKSNFINPEVYCVGVGPDSLGPLGLLLLL